MNPSLKIMKNLSAATLIGAVLTAPAALLAAPGGNGNGNGNAGGTAAQLAAIEAEIAALQNEVAVLGESIALLGVNTLDADCATDPDALQAAIDAAPAAGAIIGITGTCTEASIVGKSNLLLDGGAIGDGNGVTDVLTISASNNIQLEGINAGRVDIRDNASVFTGDLNVATQVEVQSSSSLLQRGGDVTIAGLLGAYTGGVVDLDRAVLGDVQLSRSASVILNANRADASPITVTGNVGSFSGSHFLAQGSIGTVSVTGAQISVSRTAAALFAGQNVIIDVDFALVQQNAVLDVLSVPDANVSVTDIALRAGGGARFAIFDNTTPYEANCDGSAWTEFAIVCAP